MAFSGAIVGSAVIGAGASMMASKTQAKGADRAAQLQAEAQRQALEEQKRQFDLTRSDFAPYRETGTNALAELGRNFGIGREGLLSEDEMTAARERFKATPGYDFRFEEGIRALDRSAAAKGKLRGGGYGRELTRYGQGIAADEYGTYTNALSRLAGIGQSATGSTAAAGQASANAMSNIYQTGASQQGNALMNSATARASGYAGVGNAVSGGVENALFYNALKSGAFRPTTPGSNAYATQFATI